MITLQSCKEEDSLQDNVKNEVNTVTDIDGNVYQSVVIGTQEWMTENLKVTHYRNGDEIPRVSNVSLWCNLITGAYNWPEDSVNYLNIYGGLYNWYAVIDSRNLCPIGWHIPTIEEWMVLIDYSGGYAIAGGKLKSARTEPEAHPRWQTPNVGATDSYGFSALPAGFTNGHAITVGGVASFWSITNANTPSLDHEDARCIEIYADDIRASNNIWYQYLGLSIRCIKD